MELEKELVRALRPLALDNVPAHAVAALFDTGGTAATREQELADSASLRQLRGLDLVFAKYLRRQVAAANREENGAADPQVARLWAFFASQDAVAAVVGEQSQDDGVALYRSLFTLLQSVLNVREVYANMHDGEKRSALVKALVVAKVYLSWLQLPGGSAYGLFMPYVYRQVLDILKKWVVLMAKVPDSASIARKGKKNRRGRPTRRAAKRKQSDGSESDEDGDEAQDYWRVTQYGLELLDMLTTFLGNFSLSSSKESIVPTIETAVALQTAVAPANEDTAASVTSKTLELLEALVVDGSHGDPLEIARVIIRCYIPGVTFQETVAKENNCALRFHKLSIDVISRIQRLTAKAFSDEDEARRESSLMRLGLLQNLCLQAPDRAEFRGRVLAYAFATAMAGRQGKTDTDGEDGSQGLRDEECVRLVRFLASYSRNAKAKFRQFAVELLGRFVLEASFWKVKEEELPRALVMYSGVGPLVDVLIERARDKMSNVRTKAIAGISAMLTLGLSRLSDAEKATTDSDDDEMEEDTANRSEAIATSLQKLLYETSFDAEGQKTLEETPLMQRLIELFRERLADDKTFVRRAALQALEALLTAHSGDAVLASSRKDLFDIHGRCTDSSVVVRVQAIKSLSSILLKFPQDEEAQKLWNLGVLPLCVDPETTVQSCALDWTGKVVFDRVLEWYKVRRNDVRRDMLSSVWDLVSHLDGVMARCAQKALRMLIKNDKISIQLIIQACIYAIKLSVSSYSPDEDGVDDEASTRELTRYWGFSWVVLEELAHSGKLIEAVKSDQENLGVVVECWNKLQDQALPVAFNDGSKRILRVIAAISTVIDPQDAKSMADSILASLHSFAIPLNVIADAVLALNSICKARAPSAEKGRVISFAWGKKLLELCESSLRKCFENNAEDVTEETALLQKQLISIGEVALLEFDKDGDKGADAAGTVALVPVSAGLKSLVQLFLPPKFVPNNNGSNRSMSQATEEEEEVSAPVSFTAVPIPTPVRVCAFVTLGKLCLRDQDLAKKCMTMFIRELRTCPEQDIRSNILLILGDLCIRYTSLVDTYITTIALSLLDESRLLRRSALLLFSQLILQDYIKWRESLLRFFLRAAVDEDEELSNLARHVLCGPLLQKSPHIFMNKFIEMIFVLNRFEGNKLKFSEPFEKEGVRELALLGDARFPRRARLYKFLLENMSDEQKLQISMKLCNEVLEDVLDGKLPLCDNPSQITDHCTEAVLKDTFAILCSPQIKLSTSKDEEEDVDGEDVPAAGNGSSNTATQLAVAKGKLLSKMSKKNFLENVVPVLIGLKHTLEAKHSPLTRYVLHYIRELFKLYRQEVKDIFMNTDPQMAMEVEYDLRQYELQQEKQQQQQAQAYSSRAQANVTPTKPMSPLSQVQANGMATPAPTAPRTPQEQLLEASHTPLRLREEQVSASAEKTTPARARRRQSLPATPTPSRSGVQRREVSSDEKAKTASASASPSTLIFSPSKSRPASDNGSWHVTVKSPTVGKNRTRGEKGFSQKDLEDRMHKELEDAVESSEDSGASDDKENAPEHHGNTVSRRKARSKTSKALEDVPSIKEEEEEDEEVVPLPLKKKTRTKTKTKTKTKASAMSANVTMRPKRKRK